MAIRVFSAMKCLLSLTGTGKNISLSLFRKLGHSRGIAAVESNLALEFIEAYHQRNAIGDEKQAEQALKAAKQCLFSSYDAAKKLR